MKFMIFGFSVTGQKQGYADIYAGISRVTNPEDEIIAIGLGGLYPVHARHLTAQLFAKHRPDCVVIEFTTALFATEEGTEARRAGHRETMLSILRLCNEMGLRCAIFDLPRSDLKPENNWVAEIHHELALRYAFPHKQLALIPEGLNDVVHTNELGSRVYAEALGVLIAELKTSNQNLENIEAGKRYSAYSLSDMEIAGGSQRGYSRAGFEFLLCDIPAGEPVHIKLPKPAMIAGAIIKMGPTTGEMIWTYADKSEKMHCYDIHCYYERVNGRSLAKAISDSITIVQTNDLPQRELSKGTKYLGDRVGGFTHILFEE